eukprot:6208558-Pleurochrysis_carterae.AAC.2
MLPPSTVLSGRCPIIPSCNAVYPVWHRLRLLCRVSQDESQEFIIGELGVGEGYRSAPEMYRYIPAALLAAPSSFSRRQACAFCTMNFL